MRAREYFSNFFGKIQKCYEESMKIVNLKNYEKHQHQIN